MLLGHPRVVHRKCSLGREMSMACPGQLEDTVGTWVTRGPGRGARKGTLLVKSLESYPFIPAGRSLKNNADGMTKNSDTRCFSADALARVRLMMAQPFPRPALPAAHFRIHTPHLSTGTSERSKRGHIKCRLGRARDRRVTFGRRPPPSLRIDLPPWCAGPPFTGLREDGQPGPRVWIWSLGVSDADSVVLEIITKYFSSEERATSRLIFDKVLVRVTEQLTTKDYSRVSEHRESTATPPATVGRPY
ncbi:hypothetical protein B0H17DRAFT_1181768 [Mycena rosella]|uniref:Uncharacterized protein n=1 Tax=Mycena rosella TaxID=1033263 RepID=A0AAD7GCN8_MYCRO|nr:hypothetical protein B0H17DRAFT_1181768 [Mycena rosella]